MTLPIKKSPRPNGLTTELHQTSQELIPNSLKLFKLFEGRESFRTPYINPASPFSKKDATTTTTTKRTVDHYLMNANAEILSKVLAG